MDKYTKSCLICNAVFTDKKHPNRKYCSHNCAVESQRKKETRYCIRCNEPFIANPSDKKTHCGLSCSQSNKANPDKKETRQCKWCGKDFIVWKYRVTVYCSHKCMSQYAARQPKPNLRRPENFIVLNCEICDKEYKVHKCMVENRKSSFCSSKCKHEARSQAMIGERNHNYKGGHTSFYYGRGWRKLAYSIRLRDNFTCQKCGKRTTERKKLHVHHITKFREFKGDTVQANQESNLVALCTQCHIKVDRLGEVFQKRLL